uniref:Uncharacterized protein n=1 Tax=Bionectria ochroleuca TaxID=29856 RepID=A0A8H7NH29_BIOOC
MRLSLVYLAVFAAPSLVHGRRHRCSRSTPLSSAAATPDTSNGWTSTPSASVSPSSVIIASSSTPILSESSAVSPSASASTPGSDVPTTFSTATTPAGTPSSTDVSATPSSTDSSATPSSILSSTSLEVSSASETPIASTTPAESTTPITQTTPSASTVSSESTTPVSSTVVSSSSSSSAPAATPTGWQLQSSGANSAFAGSFMLGYAQYKDAPHLVSPSASTPDVYSKLEFYIEPGTGHLFWVIDGTNNRYQFFTSYDEFNEFGGEYYYNVNPGFVGVIDVNQVGSRHVVPLVCSRTAASFSCSANTPAGVFNHFMVNPTPSQFDTSIAFGSSVPSPYQEVTFAAVDVY